MALGSAAVRQGGGGISCNDIVESSSGAEQMVDVEEAVRKSDVVPNQQNIVSITDDAAGAALDRRMSGGVSGGSDLDEGENAKACMAARLARASRAAARELGSADDGGSGAPQQADYIPLTRPVPAGVSSEAHAKGLLADASPFGPRPVPRHALVVASTADEGCGEEVDAADEWALHQMRVGAHRRHGGAPPPELEDGGAGCARRSTFNSSVPLPPSMRAATAKPLGSDGPKSTTPGQAMAQMWETVRQLESGVGERERQSAELKARRQEAVDQLDSLECEAQGLDETLQTVQELEELSWGLGGLLDSKAMKLEQAVKTLSQMEEDFVAKRDRRRARDISDDIVREGRAELTVPPMVGADVADVGNGAVKATTAERRRLRHLRRLEASHRTREGWDTSSMSEEDGWEELAGDRAVFCAAAHKQILGDVSEGFSTISAVLRPLRKAKRLLRDDYTNAYVPPSLPDAFALYVGHSLLWWDPLKLCQKSGVQHTGTEHRGGEELVQPASSSWGPAAAVTGIELEGFSWFGELATFTELLGDSDPDGELLPQLVQRCVFSEVSRRIGSCWDISSAQQSESVAALLDECLLFDSDESATAFAGLLEVAMQRLQKGLAAHAPEVFVANEAIPTWYASKGRQRLLWRSCKIAYCALLLDGRLPDEQLRDLVLTRVYMTRIAPHLRAPRLDAEELAVVERFVAALPVRWLETGLPAALVPLRDALGPRAPSGAEAAGTVEAAVRVLRILRCYDEAQVLSEGSYGSVVFDCS